MAVPGDRAGSWRRARRRKAVPASGKTAAAKVTNVAPLYNLPVTGVAKNGRKFTGTYAIQRFVVRRGKVVSVGTGRSRAG